MRVPPSLLQVAYGDELQRTEYLVSTLEIAHVVLSRDDELIPLLPFMAHPYRLSESILLFPTSD